MGRRESRDLTAKVPWCVQRKYRNEGRELQFEGSAFGRRSERECAAVPLSEFARNDKTVAMSSRL